MLSPFTTRVKTNVDNVLQMTQMINGIMMTGDSRANQIIVELYGNSGRIAIAAGTKIVGYFIRGDGYTVEVDGEVTDHGEALVIIPQAAYIATGALSIAIRLFDDRHEQVIDGATVITYDTKIVIAALSCFVQNTETDSIVDPDHRIPDVQELLAYIDVLDYRDQLYQTHEAERVENETGRVSAESARVSAESARVSAENTRDGTEAVRINAENQRKTNENLRRSAENIRVSAETSRVNAETQRTATFNTTIQKIDGMTVDAVQLPYTSSPTATITEVNGHKHIQFGLVNGYPFVIKKTFASVYDMNHYTGTDVNVGDLVAIVSTVEDPDNAKLYVKMVSSYEFIVDMSGATGIKGDKGDKGDPGVSQITFVYNETDDCIEQTITNDAIPEASGVSF